jgi:hypothetical protein
MGIRLASAAVGILVLSGALPAEADDRWFQPPPAPLSRAMVDALRQSDPQTLTRLMHPRPQLRSTPKKGTASTTSPWTPLVNQPTFDAGAMLLLTDGTVMVQDQSTPKPSGSNWWRLTPDQTGNYANGTWSQLASMPNGYEPLYFASAVLPDGRVIAEGGEYSYGKEAWLGLGAIYDPVKNQWTPVAPPAGMKTASSSIGDAMGLVLANGKFMLSPVYFPASGFQQIFDATTLTWTGTGLNKIDGNNDEESQALLQNGNVLTVDIDNRAALRAAEMFLPKSGVWESAGNTPAVIYDKSAFEIGPELVRPDGTVLAIGANGHNAIYQPATGTWIAAPSFPQIDGKLYQVADGPGATLPSGDVLVMASPGVYETPSHFFLFSGTKLTQVADTPNAADLSSFYGMMLVLPTGQVMFNSRDGDIELYTETAKPNAAWAPTITHVATHLVAGDSYVLSGKQLNGLTQGASYGDDYQSATNYPVIRIVNQTTQHVFYARTYMHSNASIAPNAASSTHFSLPKTIEAGSSTLVVVANGIASKPVSITVSKAPS